MKKNLSDSFRSKNMVCDDWHGNDEIDEKKWKFMLRGVFITLYKKGALAQNKSSLLLKIILYNTRTLQLFKIN